MQVLHDRDYGPFVDNVFDVTRFTRESPPALDIEPAGYYVLNGNY